MKIDCNEILKEAKRKNISPYILVKRKINYRKISIDDKMKGRNCRRCKLSYISPYDVNELVCDFIGVNKDKEAVVDDEHICNVYNVMYIKF